MASAMMPMICDDVHGVSHDAMTRDDNVHHVSHGALIRDDVRDLFHDPMICDDDVHVTCAQQRSMPAW